jgi:hypothetical protein
MIALALIANIIATFSIFLSAFKKRTKRNAPKRTKRTKRNKTRIPSYKPVASKAGCGRKQESKWRTSQTVKTVALLNNVFII